MNVPVYVINQGKKQPFIKKDFSLKTEKDVLGNVLLKKNGIEKQVLNYRKYLDESKKDNDLLNNHIVNIDSTSVSERKFLINPSDIDDANVFFHHKLLTKTGESSIFQVC